MDTRMKEFHRLVEEERYREARGILETENLDPEIVAKWTKWLDELHRTERVLVGVSSDKHRPQDEQQAYAEIGQILGSSMVFVAAQVCTLVVFSGIFALPVLRKPIDYIPPVFFLILTSVIAAKYSRLGGGWLGKMLGQGVWKLTHESPKDKA